MSENLQGYATILPIPLVTRYFEPVDKPSDACTPAPMIPSRAICHAGALPVHIWRARPDRRCSSGMHAIQGNATTHTQLRTKNAGVSLLDAVYLATRAAWREVISGPY